MVAPSAGQVVLVPFPFSDLSNAKVRPAVPLGDLDFDSGGLMVASFARPGKLFTAHAGLFVRSAGVLSPQAFARVLSAVAVLFRPPPGS